MKMKDSGIDWIGMAPEEWEECLLGQIVSIQNGADYKDIEVEEGYPVIGSGGQFAYASKSMFSGEVLFLGRKGTIDIPLYYNGAFWAVDTMFYAVPNRNDNVRFLYYYSTQFPFSKISTKTALPSMTQTQLRSLSIVLPPLSEQKVIANYLDEKCGKIDEQVKLLEKKVEAYKNLKRSVINETVTRGLDKNVKLKDSGVDWIGMVPEAWEVTRLERCIYEVVVKNNPVRTTNLLSLIKDVGVILYSEKGLVGNKEKLDYSEYKVAYPNTIVANSMNILIGSVGLCNYEGCVSPVYYVFKTNALGNIKYINYLFSTRAFQKGLRKYAKGILEIRLRVSASDILKCEVPLPCLEEQQAIANYLDDKCTKIDKAIDLVQKQIDAYKRLKRSLINEVVTGKRRVA